VELSNRQVEPLNLSSLAVVSLYRVAPSATCVQPSNSLRQIYPALLRQLACVLLYRYITFRYNDQLKAERRPILEGNGRTSELGSQVRNKKSPNL
jgi:hypothetical protein